MVFKKGHTLTPKGHKRWDNPNSKRNWFKKGQTPHNFKGTTIHYRSNHPERPKPNKCEVCDAGSEETKKDICYDHNHVTGKFRGWICQRCNTALGMVRDNPETLIKLAEYIKKDNIN